MPFPTHDNKRPEDTFDGLSQYNTNDTSSNSYYIVRSAQSSLLELQGSSPAKSHPQPVVMNMKGSSNRAKAFGDSTFHHHNNVEHDEVQQQAIALQKMHISYPTHPSSRVQHSFPIADDYFSPYAPMQDTYIPSPHATRQIDTRRVVHSSSPHGWSPHERYYFRDGDVLFRISNVLYNLHLNVFGTHSKFFHDLFTALRLTPSPSPNTQKEPIVLSELKIEEFDRFLSIVYPMTPDLTRQRRTKEEWLSILSLSTRWTFASVRMLAIQQLTPMMSTEEKSMLAGKLEVKEWMIR